jgi:hypothetical protein
MWSKHVAERGDKLKQREKFLRRGMYVIDGSRPSACATLRGVSETGYWEQAAKASAMLSLMVRESIHPGQRNVQAADRLDLPRQMLRA